MLVKNNMWQISVQSVWFFYNPSRAQEPWLTACLYKVFGMIFRKKMLLKISGFGQSSAVLLHNHPSFWASQVTGKQIFPIVEPNEIQ